MVKTKIALGLAIAIASPALLAGKWQFKPSVKIDETYSDNVELLNDSETTSLVSQSAFLLNTEYQSQLLNFSLNSESTYAFYSHDHDLDDDYHTLNSQLNLKLGKRGFSLFGSANIDNQSNNSSRNALADIVSADVSRVENYIGGIAFDLDNRDFVLNSSIAYNLKQSEDEIGESKGYQGSISTQNGQSARLVFWEGQGSYQELENNDQTARTYQGEFKLGWITGSKLIPFLRYYDEDNSGSIGNNNSLESNSYGAGIRWQLTNSTRLDISYNEPIGSQLDLDGEEQKAYVDAKIEWQPTQRTKLEASYTQRFYGDAYNFAFTHLNKRMTNSIQYSEEVQSFTRNNFVPISLGSFWCPTGNTDNLTNCYTNNDTNIDFDNYQLVTLSDFELIEDDVLSLNKSINWNSQLTLPRTTFTIQISGNERENLETNIIDETISASLSITRKVSGRSNLSLKGSYTDNHYQIDSDTERQDRYRQVSIGYQKLLNSNLSFDFDLAHVNRSSDDQQFNYQEGRVTFKITKDF